MSIRPEIRPYQVITSGLMTGNLTSLPTIIQKISMVSYTHVWTGTSPVGTVGVQVSNDFSIDPTGNTLNAGTWSTYSFLSAGTYVTSVAVAGNAGNIAIELPNISFYAVRTIFTFTSGTGTLNSYINGKVS